MPDATTQTVIARAVQLERARRRSGPQTTFVQVRFPDHLHAWLVDVAGREGISLNAVIVSALSIVRADEVAR